MLQRLISPEALPKLLQDGIDKGRWTLEDLDKPSPSFLIAQQDSMHPKSLCQGKFPSYWNPLREPPKQQPPSDPSAGSVPEDGQPEPSVLVQGDISGREHQPNRQPDDSRTTQLDGAQISGSSTKGDSNSQSFGDLSDNGADLTGDIPW